MKRFTYRSTLAFRPVTISGVDVVRQVIGHQLADTTGMANPKRVRQRVKAVLDLVQRGRLTLHQCDGGFRCRRAPVRFVPRGLGGCPFAPGGVGAMSAQRPPLPHSRCDRTALRRAPGHIQPCEAPQLLKICGACMTDCLDDVPKFRKRLETRAQFPAKHRRNRGGSREQAARPTMPSSSSSAAG